jgi:hypothetical protein
MLVQLSPKPLHLQLPILVVTCFSVGLQNGDIVSDRRNSATHHIGRETRTDK